MLPIHLRGKKIPSGLGLIRSKCFQFEQDVLKSILEGLSNPVQLCKTGAIGFTILFTIVFFLPSTYFDIYKKYDNRNEPYGLP